jgi:hypothetical protein
VEHGGVLHRSSWPQQVRPLGREAPPLATVGADGNLSDRVAPQSGQEGELAPDQTRISARLPHALQRYS